jgi:NitT/TauT family transport system substrate-binding protein
VSGIGRFGCRGRRVGFAVAAIAALGAAGCGSSQKSDSTSSQGSASASGSSGHCSSYTKLKVGYVPSLSGLSVLVGAKTGVFKAQCLDVTPTLVTAPPNAYPELLSGQIDALDGSGLITATFVANGAPINLVGGLEVESPTVENNSQNWWQIVTLKSNKSINSLDDLIGKSVGVGQLNSFTELGAETALDKEGKDPNSIKWVVIPPANQLAALKSGQVQALYAGEPSLTTDEQTVPIKSVFSGSPVANTPIGAYAMTKSYEAKHPAAFKQFQKAIPLAYAAIQTHKPLAKQLIQQSLHLSQATVDKMRFPTYVKEFPVAAEDAALKLELKFGFIKKIPAKSDLYALPNG